MNVENGFVAHSDAILLIICLNDFLLVFMLLPLAIFSESVLKITCGDPW